VRQVGDQTKVILRCAVNQPSRFVILCLLNCVIETVQVTKRCRYFPQGSHELQPTGGPHKSLRTRLRAAIVCTYIEGMGDLIH